MGVGQGGTVRWMVLGGVSGVDRRNGREGLGYID